MAALAETGAASHVLEHLLGQASANLGGDNRKHLEAQLSIMKEHCARLQKELQISAPALAKSSPAAAAAAAAAPRKEDVAGVQRELRDSPSRRRGPSSDVLAQRQRAWRLVSGHLGAPEPEFGGRATKTEAAARKSEPRRLSAASASRFTAIRSMQGHIATGSGLTRLRVGGVPEHFNAPFHLAKASGALDEAGVSLDWKVGFLFLFFRVVLTWLLAPV